MVGQRLCAGDERGRGSKVGLGGEDTRRLGGVPLVARLRRRAAEERKAVSSGASASRTDQVRSGLFWLFAHEASPISRKMSSISRVLRLRCVARWPDAEGAPMLSSPNASIEREACSERVAATPGDEGLPGASGPSILRWPRPVTAENVEDMAPHAAFACG